MHRDLKHPPSKIIDGYLKLQEKFSRYSCRRGEDHKYEKLFNKYKSAKYHIPIINEITLDVDAISFILPEFEKKLSWMREEINKLKATGRISSQKYVTYVIKKTINDLLLVKEHYVNASSGKEQEQYRLQSAELIKKLKDDFQRMLAQITFLRNYAFPVDHLQMRLDYDHYKGKDDVESQKKKNIIYLQRLLVEDGAFSSISKNGDVYLRSFLNTLSFRLSDVGEILSEDIRYDLEHVIDKVEFILTLGYKKQLERMQEWFERVVRTRDFYKRLLTNYHNSPLEKRKTDDMLEKRAKARFALESYVFEQEAKVYKFWQKQSETNKALFTLETILMNEVGAYDQEGIEKLDIVGVVVNRTGLKQYNQFLSSDPLIKYLVPLIPKNLEGEKWLNVLFKRGEFSFTYYHIPETVRIFCPDMSNTRRKLRNKNLQIAINRLKHPNKTFSAVRYFSRISMLGGIDAGQLWKGFTPLPERPGMVIGNSKKLHNLFKKGQYRYLYTFLDDRGRPHDVVEIESIKYVLRKNGNSILFHKYRDPNYFRYFTKS